MASEIDDEYSNATAGDSLTRRGFVRGLLAARRIVMRWQKSGLPNTDLMPLLDDAVRKVEKWNRMLMEAKDGE